MNRRLEADFMAGKAFAVNWLFRYSDSNDATKSKIVGQAAFAPMPIQKLVWMLWHPETPACG